MVEDPRHHLGIISLPLCIDLYTEQHGILDARERGETVCSEEFQRRKLNSTPACESISMHFCREEHDKHIQSLESVFGNCTILDSVSISNA